jgi:conserved oligomeric Golgi complex subunit 2
MAVRSPDAHTFISVDPFQLDRLAEELVARESSHTVNRPADDNLTEPSTHDLPAYVPLSHDNPHLKATTFNVEEFLLSRSYTSLPDLRAELREYLSELKEELVKLINDDYEAFISLSTDLKDEGVRLIRLKSPLGDLRSQIFVSLRL